MASFTTWINPYVIGPPIQDPNRFFGREDLFQFIRSELSKATKVILLHGQRRIGKSSVLAQIPRLEGLSGFVFVSLDLQYETGLPLGRVLHDLAEKIVKDGGLEGQISAPSEGDLQQDEKSFAEGFLPRVFELLGASKLVLLLDEFDVLAGGSGDGDVQPFFHYLRSIIYDQAGLQVIAVVGRRLDDLTQLQSLFHDVPSQEVGLLDPDSAKRLITKPAEGLLEFSPEAIEAILELSAGHPYFTQLLSYAAFQRAPGDTGLVVLRSGVENVVDKAMESGGAGLDWFRSGLPIPERVVFSAVAESQEGRLPSAQPAEPSSLLRDSGVAETDALRKAIDRLVEWGFVRRSRYRTTTGGRPLAESELYEGTFVLRVRYHVTVELVRRWLVKHHPLRQVIRELEKVNDEARRAYQAAQEAQSRGDQAATGNHCAEALRLNPNHFSALFDLAALSLELGDFESAEQQYRRAYRVDPTPLMAEKLAQALVGNGRRLAEQGTQEAEQRFKEALDLEPENEEAKQELKSAKEKARRILAAHNPFIVGLPVAPGQFVGRKKEVEEILSTIASQGHVAVFGERRMGKTSLLRYIGAPEVLRDRGLNLVPPLYLDCSLLQPFSPGAFWRELGLAVAKRITEQPETFSILERLVARLSTLISVPSTSGTLRILLARNSLVLLLDEFDVALQSHGGYSEPDIRAFLQQLRTLASPVTEGIALSLSYVIATRRSPVELLPALGEASPWQNLFRLVPLRRFNEEETSELVHKMPEPFAPNEEELGWLRQVAGGYPYLLQAALYTLFRLHANDQPFDVGRALRDLAEAIEPFLRSFWAGASNEERAWLTLLALREYELRLAVSLSGFTEYEAVFSQRRRELRAMEERSLIVPDTDRGYLLGSTLLAWWIMQEIEDSREAQNQQGLGALFQAEIFGHQRADQLRDAIRQVRERRAASDRIEAWGYPLPARS